MNDMQVNWRKWAILRKSVAIVARMYGSALASRAGPEDYASRPPVLCNSFPKSGTHLLKQILQGMGPLRDYGAFLASMPSITFRERPPEAIAGKIAHLAPGELAAAHLHFDPAVAAALARRHVVHLFIYRDLRDVAVSEAHYLTHMNRWHRLHRYYRAIPTDLQRITMALKGAGDAVLPYDYPDIAARFDRYHPWLGRDDVLAVKFEDLIGHDRPKAVRRIVRFYLDRCRGGGEDEAVQRALAGIDPGRSHTYHEGKAGTWREVFTDEHRQLARRIAGQLLIDLGYESNQNW